MSKKIHSLDSNSDEEYGDWNDYVLGLFIRYTRDKQAKKIDDYIFQEYEED